MTGISLEETDATISREFFTDEMSLTNEKLTRNILHDQNSKHNMNYNKPERSTKDTLIS